VSLIDLSILSLRSNEKLIEAVRLVLNFIFFTFDNNIYGQNFETFMSSLLFYCGFGYASGVMGA